MKTVAHNVLQYLVQANLLSQDAVVNGGLVLSMQRSRNRFFLLKQPSGPCYFIKQALESEAMTAVTVAREAAIYQGVFADARLSGLRELLPRFYLFDEKNCVLVTELLKDAACLADLVLDDPSDRAAVAAKLGQALACCHQVRFVPGQPQAAIFPQEPPWIFLLFTQADLGHLRRSPAASALIDALLSAEGLAGQLQELRDSWARDTLIHGDIKLENCLLAAPVGGGGVAQRKLYVVDWELADIGDAAWDVGGALQAFLNGWIVSINPAPNLPVEQWLESATFPLASAQAGIQAFWNAYAADSGHLRSGGVDFLLRCTRMMAVRMLVTAFESSTRADSLHPRSLLMLQVALNVLQQPAAAVERLLGFQEVSRAAA